MPYPKLLYSDVSIEFPVPLEPPRRGIIAPRTGRTNYRISMIHPPPLPALVGQKWHPGEDYECVAGPCGVKTTGILIGVGGAIEDAAADYVSTVRRVVDELTLRGHATHPVTVYLAGLLEDSPNTELPDLFRL